MLEGVKYLDIMGALARKPHVLNHFQLHESPPNPGWVPMKHFRLRITHQCGAALPLVCFLNSSLRSPLELFSVLSDTRQGLGGNGKREGDEWFIRFAGHHPAGNFLQLSSEKVV